MCPGTSTTARSRLLALPAHQERHQVLRPLRVGVHVLLLLLREVGRQHVRGRHAEVLELLLLLLLAQGHLLGLQLRHRRRLSVEPDASAAEAATHAVVDTEAARPEAQELRLVVCAEVHAVAGAHAAQLVDRHRIVVVRAVHGAPAAASRAVVPDSPKVVERLLLRQMRAAMWRPKVVQLRVQELGSIVWRAAAEVGEAWWEALRWHLGEVLGGENGWSAAELILLDGGNVSAEVALLAERVGART